jgi:hypothetical protein
LAGNNWNFFIYFKIHVKILFSLRCRFFCFDLLRRIAGKKLYAVYSGLCNVSEFFDYFFAVLVCFFRVSNLIIQRQSLWKQYNGLR